jgi:hypothetical protein
MTKPDATRATPSDAAEAEMRKAGITDSLLISQVRGAIQDAIRSEKPRSIELEEGWNYWTHEGYVLRHSKETEKTELLGPGGWTEAM